jgi:hypothetical protein
MGKILFPLVEICILIFIVYILNLILDLNHSFCNIHVIIIIKIQINELSLESKPTK